MSCILCFNTVTEDDSFSLHDYTESTMLTAAELMNKYFSRELVEKILLPEILRNPDTSLCKTCWSNLETFNDFYTFVAANYSGAAVMESREEKYHVPHESEMIVYDEEHNESMENEMIKVEYLTEANHEYMETEWIDEQKQEVQSKPKVKRILSLPIPGQSRQPANLNLDSADDQRIRETANMFCDICQNLLDSLREAKSHFKQAHGIEGYIVCCDRKFKQRCRLVEHVNTHYNYTYRCSICAKTFDSKSYLSKHMACHDDNKQYVS